MQISHYETNLLSAPFQDYLNVGVNPNDYIDLPSGQGGHKWKSIQVYNFTLDDTGNMTIIQGDHVATYEQVLALLNRWIDAGYNCILEAGLSNWLNVSEPALTAFMLKLNQDLHGQIIWVAQNEINGSWNQQLYGFSTWPPTQDEINRLNAFGQTVRRIRDTNRLTKIRLSFQPNHDISGVEYQFAIDLMKSCMDAGDFYSLSSYWSSGIETQNYFDDADNLIDYMLNGTAGRYPGQFGGYANGYSGKTWLLAELGHKEFMEVNPREWTQRILANLKAKAPFVKLVIFWGAQDFAALRDLAPLYETSENILTTAPPITGGIGAIVGGVVIVVTLIGVAAAILGGGGRRG